MIFKNLDNNLGVLHHLIDTAEEEECKETILAYHHSLIANRPLSAEELDKYVESWFRDKYSCTLDFEMQNALEKCCD